MFVQVCAATDDSRLCLTRAARLVNTTQLTGLWRAARWLPLLFVTACGSINAIEDDGGAAGTAGASGSAGAGGTPAGVAGTTGLGGSGAGGAAGSVVNLGGSVGKDGGQADGANPDVLDCMPGERRCDDNTPMTCSANHVWQAGTRCGNVCAAGACVGVCTPGMRTCVGNIPQLCDSQGLWQAAPACGYVCRQGDCTGVCMPGARQCTSAGVPQSCNVDGAWESEQPCPFVCNQGVCSGVCRPGDVGCNNNVPRTCNSTGEWQSGAACPYVCTAGQCAGSCTPGARQCANNVPQTCSNGGAWQNGTACPYVCSGGMCGGSCVPGANRCANGQKQVCDASGNWQDTTTPSVQLLANGAFDAGQVAWSETTVSSSTIITNESALTTLRAHTPANLAWLAGYANAQDDLSQTVTIPAGASAITLSFYYVIQSQETTAGVFDTMDVYTYDPAMAKFTALASFNDNMPTPSWTRFSISLPLSMAGRTIKIGFQSMTDNVKTTNFFVDSVALDVVACTP
jgi:hypothetical protein